MTQQVSWFVPTHT